MRYIAERVRCKTDNIDKILLQREIDQHKHLSVNFARIAQKCFYRCDVDAVIFLYRAAGNAALFAYFVL